MVRAGDARRREFASGRALLRHLLEQDVALPIGDDRRPVLPAGVRASLAHDRTLVVAAVTRSASIVSLGLDLEPVASVTPADAKLILRSDEVGLDASLAFCLKEAAYKAWSAPGRQVLEHHDVRVSVDGVRFVASVLDGADEFVGAWTTVGGRWLALVAQLI